MKQLCCFIKTVCTLSLFFLASSMSGDDAFLVQPDRSLIWRAELFQPLLPEFQGVCLLIENPSTQGAYIFIENKSDLDIFFGTEFIVLEKIRSEWFLVDFTPETKWGLLLIIKELHYASEQYIDFNHYFGSLPPGSYRLIQSIFPFTDWEIRNSVVYLYADFAIE